MFPQFRQSRPQGLSRFSQCHLRFPQDFFIVSGFNHYGSVTYCLNPDIFLNIELLKDAISMRATYRLFRLE